MGASKLLNSVLLLMKYFHARSWLAGLYPETSQPNKYVFQEYSPVIFEAQMPIRENCFRVI